MGTIMLAATLGATPVRISDRSAGLQRAAIASQVAGAVVPKAERKWCTRLDSKTSGFYVSVDPVRKSFEAMQAALSLPGDGEAGMKLVRGSMAHIARQRLGERDWIEGQIMLGHKRITTSDTYAPFDIGYLARALGVTDGIIAEMEKLVPGAFQSTMMPASEPAI